VAASSRRPNSHILFNEEGILVFSGSEEENLGHKK
jgi:hypothetical protein